MQLKLLKYMTTQINAPPAMHLEELQGELIAMQELTIEELLNIS